MFFYGRSSDVPKSLTLTYIKCLLFFLGITGVNGQAFRFSQITLSRPTSAVGATLQASCNATYLASTAFVMDWRINDTVVVGLYQITNNMVPQLANGTHHFDVVFSTVTTTINTGDTFEVNLEIRNLNLDDNQTAISVTCTNCVQVSTLINVEVCKPETLTGVIASNVPDPCGLGCQVQYSCKSGFTGPNITATCLADATFDATPSCVQNGNCSLSAITYETLQGNLNSIIGFNESAHINCAPLYIGNGVDVLCKANSTLILSRKINCTKVEGNTDSGLSVGAKVGIAFGVICGVILLIILIWILILLFCIEICCCKLIVCGRNIGKKGEIAKENQKDKKSDGSNGSETTHP